MAFCSNCGTELKSESKFCPDCGAPIGANTETTPPPSIPQEVFIYEKKSKGLTLTLCFFGGCVGAHLFYLRHYLSASLYLLFCWTFIPLILSWGDFIVYLFLPEKKFHEIYDKRI